MKPPEILDYPYTTVNPCYLLAFIEQDGDGGADTGDYFGFYGYAPYPEPGIDDPNVFIEDAGLEGFHIVLNEEPLEP